MLSNITMEDIKMLMEADTEGVLGDLTNKENSFFKSGEFLFTMLKLGYSVFDIRSIILISDSIIENRVMEYILNNDNSEEYLKFLYNNVKGIKNLDIFKHYVSSTLSTEQFIKMENIRKVTFNRIITKFESIPFFKKKIQEREERIIKINQHPITGIKNTSMVRKTYSLLKLF